MAERDREHFYLRGVASPESYAGQGFPPDGPGAPGNPNAHAKRLREEYERANKEADDAVVLAPEVEGRLDGFTVEFESQSGFGLDLERALFTGSAPGLKPELKAVTERITPDGVVEIASVFIPVGTAGTFLAQLSDYETKLTDKGNRQQAGLVERIAAIRHATLRGIWTDDPAKFPAAGEATWWEVWLRQRDGNERDRLAQYCDATGIAVRDRALRIDDRTIVLVRATVEELASAIDVLDDLVELRRPSQQSAVLADLPPNEQADWVNDLAGRLIEADDDSPAVCLLDSGVVQSHPLLEASLDLSDCHTVEPSWTSADHHGHGTEMAGVALFGDLAEALLSNGPFVLRHRLESSKIYESAHATEPDTYGAVTAEAIQRPEISAPTRQRVHSLTITAPVEAGRANGEPTAWSASVDALIAGRGIHKTSDGLVYLEDAEDRTPRLLIVSGGSIRLPDPAFDHLDYSDTAMTQDPAQAWNAVTVGAHTEIHDLSGDTTFDGWSAVATPGELSPFSSTGVEFSKPWPNKPDVVDEGGNMAVSPGGSQVDSPPLLQVLTTGQMSKNRLLSTAHGTSPAAAHVANVAAQIWAMKPDLWPETVRGLLVHSATWTPKMAARIMDSHLNLTARRSLLHRYGFGVPNLDRAVRSATDALTLVVEDIIHPFKKKSMRELHLHALPWPTDELSALGDTEVRMRVTLSYYIDPNPSRRGWRRRFAYQSHGLRFAVRQPTETVDRFRKRINKAAREEDETGFGSSDDPGWLLGPTTRDKGSLHADIWIGSAADLALRDTIAVFPVSGWWKDQPKRDRSELGPATRCSFLSKRHQVLLISTPPYLLSLACHQPQSALLSTPDNSSLCESSICAQFGKSCSASRWRFSEPLVAQ